MRLKIKINVEKNENIFSFVGEYAWMISLSVYLIPNYSLSLVCLL